MTTCAVATWQGCWDPRGGSTLCSPPGTAQPLPSPGLTEGREMQQEAVRGSAGHAPGKAWRFSAPVLGLAWGPCPHMGTLAPGRRTHCSRVHRRGVSTSRPSGPASAIHPPSHCTSMPCASRPAWAWCGPRRGLGSRVDSSAPFSGPCPGSSPLSLRPGVRGQPQPQPHGAGRPAQRPPHLRAHSSFLSWLAPRQDGLCATTQHSPEADPSTSTSPCATSSRKPS